MDALSIVQDEVALEGLDGITIHSLWIRLENRNPRFPLKLDTCTKEYIWRSLINNIDIEFYELPQDRGDVVLFDRFAEEEPDTEIQTNKFYNAEKDVYPVNVIVDDKNGNQGSCVLYKERRNVTKNIRTQDLEGLVNLEEALKRYGRKLVVVASQVQRFHALIGAENDPELKLADQSYCILERVGRARWQGELQRDLHMSSFRTDAGKLHYLRTCLDRNGLITMQSHVIRLPTGQQQHSILLLLKRFHVIRRSNNEILMETLSNILLESPGQVASMITLRQQLNCRERTLKRVFQYMLTAKLAEIVSLPLEDLNPSAGPCTTRRGSKLTTRCLKLIKPYVKKELMVEDDDDDDNDGAGQSKSVLPLQAQIMERDVVSQAYHIIVSTGTRGISQSALQLRMNIGKLEARMLCRKLVRDGMIKGLMEDIGRQRTTKFIGHMCVGVSDQVQQFTKEQERNKLLCSSSTQIPAPQNPTTSPAVSKACSTPRSQTKGSTKMAEAEEVVEPGSLEEPAEEEEGDSGSADGGKEEEKGRPRGAGKKAGMKSRKRSLSKRSGTSVTQCTPNTCESPDTSRPCRSRAEVSALESPPTAEQTQGEEDSVLSPVNHVDESKPLTSADDAQSNIRVVEEIPQRKNPSQLERSHQTYRLLRRKNQIVEAVRSVKIVEGLYTLQKMINDEEKLDGVSTKCCKKSILRLIRMLSKEGMVKMYTTTVIQDGVSKKVEFVVHPSVQPNDDMVTRAIEQVRFRISSSYAVARVQQAQEKAKQQEMESKEENGHSSKEQNCKAGKNNTASKENDVFQPTIVRGLSRTLGFQPKMHRLRLIHTFLWYVVYGHPLQQVSSCGAHPSPTQLKTDASTSGPFPAEPQATGRTESASPSDGGKDMHTSPRAAEHPAESPTSPSAVALSGDEDSLNLPEQSFFDSSMKVYLEELSWKRFLPPLRVHKEFGHGWALVSDVVLCLPLSIFIQVTQINYKVDGLEEYLNDPVKQHYLVRVLPSRMKRQLLYKRRYIFSFYENMQKLVYMGLLQFGPFEKFQDKDQVFVYIRLCATIVDTTSAEPHYWQITESPDKPFERRRYTFTTAEDVENYWFDLLCVCLNTPLGVIRLKRGEKEVEQTPLTLPDRHRFLKLAYLLKGSREETDDGSVPGDGKGAGGLDSEFFAHLKRNWLWTNYLLACKKNLSDGELISSKMRLKSLLSKSALRLALKAGETTSPRCVTTKRPLFTEENVEMAVEPASRNQQVAGGKTQKRKRSKKEVVKVPRKRIRKEPKKRTPAHDEADHRALRMMTRQRVYWSLQEDSMLMLCSVASKLLNSKLKRPFVPYCVVRDMLQAELETSMDKTSLAAGRRTRYILKNPQTLLNFRICLAEVYQDKALMDELEQKKPSNPNRPEDCADAFSEYTRLLRQKYSSSSTACDITIPNSTSQLFSRYRVYTIDDENQMTFEDKLACTEDIHAIVLHNLIQSTLVMSNSQMKTTRSFQTFHMYSMYNQEVLCQVFIQCRRKGLVNRRRVHKSCGPKKNRALPILPMSYQLSQTYYRYFAWRFPFNVFTEAFRFIRALRDYGTGDGRPSTAFYHEMEGRAADGEALTGRGAESVEEAIPKEKEAEAGVQDNQHSIQEGDRPGGAAEKPVAAAHLQTQRNHFVGATQEEGHQSKAKEEVAVATKGDEEEKRAAGEETHPQAHELSAVDSFTVNEGVRPGSGPASNSPRLAPDDAQDLSDMLRFPLDSLGGACAASLTLMSLGLLSVHVSIPKQVVVVDSNMVKNEVVKSMAALEEEEDDDDDDAQDCEGKKRVEVKAHQASHTNYLMMRGYCYPGIVKLRNLNTTDNIVVESCILRFTLRNTPAHQIFINQDSPPLDFSKCGPSLLPSILSCNVRLPSSPPSPASLQQREVSLMTQRGFSRPDVEACAELRCSLEQAGENGLGEQRLYQMLAHLAEPKEGRTRSLQQYMQELQEEGQVIKAGALEVRWVLPQHARPWLLTISQKPRLQLHNAQVEQVPLWETKHGIPFMRKRSRDIAAAAGKQPPVKKKRRGEPSSVPTEEQRSTSAELEDETGGGRWTHPEQEVGRRRRRSEEEDNEGRGKAAEDYAIRENRLERKDEGETTETGGKGRDESLCSTPPPPAVTSEAREEEVSFISRPWRMVDGSINRQACKGMLEGLLYHIMSRPGLTQQTLVEHYKDVLQPMAVLDLVEALMEMGCVRKKSLVSVKASLFSSRSASRPTETVFYEPTISCCLRLAQVLPNEAHWNPL